jgi:hypothetical protein
MKDLLYESKPAFTVPRRHTIKKYNAKVRFLAGAGHQPVQAAVINALVERVKERLYEMEKKKREELGFEHVTIRKRPLPMKSMGKSLRQQVLISETVSFLLSWLSP